MKLNFIDCPRDEGKIELRFGELWKEPILS